MCHKNDTNISVVRRPWLVTVALSNVEDLLFEPRLVSDH